jgi:hypothetical protein
MKIPFQFGVTAFANAFLLLTLASAQSIVPLSSTDEVVAKMVERDTQREAELGGYTATRHYVGVHKRTRAEMKVEVTCTGNGAKQFKILSEEGPYVIRSLVLERMLKEEAESSRPEIRKFNRIAPGNYDFRLMGKDSVNGHPAYLLQVTPKHINKYLIEGNIWVDAEDYSIVRIEGQPARNPSFWIRTTHFVHTYQKVGPFWFAASTHSVSDIRIYGSAEVMIDNYDYVTRTVNNHSDGNRQARLGQ